MSFVSTHFNFIHSLIQLKLTKHENLFKNMRLKKDPSYTPTDSQVLGQDGIWYDYIECQEIPEGVNPLSLTPDRPQKGVQIVAIDSKNHIHSVRHRKPDGSFSEPETTTRPYIYFWYLNNELRMRDMPQFK